MDFNYREPKLSICICGIRYFCKFSSINSEIQILVDYQQVNDIRSELYNNRHNRHNTLIINYEDSDDRYELKNVMIKEIAFNDFSQQVLSTIILSYDSYKKINYYIENIVIKPEIIKNKIRKVKVLKLR